MEVPSSSGSDDFDSMWTIPSKQNTPTTKIDQPAAVSSQESDQESGGNEQDMYSKVICIKPQPPKITMPSAKKHENIIPP